MIFSSRLSRFVGSRLGDLFDYVFQIEVTSRGSQGSESKESLAAVAYHKGGGWLSFWFLFNKQQEIQNTECKWVCEAIIILFLGHESVTLFPKIILLLITRAYYLSSEGVYQYYVVLNCIEAIRSFWKLSLFWLSSRGNISNPTNTTTTNLHLSKCWIFAEIANF